VRVHSAEGEVEGKHFVSCLVPKVQQNRIHSWNFESNLTRISIPF
jgi:hypothetical protein